MVRGMSGEAGYWAKTRADKFHSANLLEDVAVSEIRTLRAFEHTEMKTNQSEGCRLMIL